MATWKLYEFVNARDSGVITAWIAAQQVAARAKLRAKIKALQQYGGGLPKTILSDTDEPHIKKLRPRGRTNLRLMLCKGPINNSTEFTLLHGVYEKDNHMPEGSIALAEQRRQQVINSPATRRKLYEP